MILAIQRFRSISIRALFQLKDAGELFQIIANNVGAAAVAGAPVLGEDKVQFRC